MRAARPLFVVAALAAAAASVLFVSPAGAAASRTAASYAAPPNCGSTIYKADGSAWTCTFSDDFNGGSLDPGKWVAVTTANSGVTQGGACYTDSSRNISVGNGVLTLTARRESAAFVCKSLYWSFWSQYTAGQVATKDRFSQKHGRFSIRAKFPAATVAGLQSALWMWPQSNSSASGEIDIAEEYSQYADRVIPTLHYAYDSWTVNAATSTNLATNYFCMIGNVNAFHQYTLIWSATNITVQYDGQTCLSDNFVSTADVFDEPYFLILTQTLGIGTNAFDPASTPLPASTQVDWVRAWK
jgi:beta-glucanase (GH16 family)